jgi:hypothetical protein
MDFMVFGNRWFSSGSGFRSSSVAPGKAWIPNRSGFFGVLDGVYAALLVRNCINVRGFLAESGSTAIKILH